MFFNLHRTQTNGLNDFQKILFEIFKPANIIDFICVDQFRLESYVDITFLNILLGNEIDKVFNLLYFQ